MLTYFPGYAFVVSSWVRSHSGCPERILMKSNYHKPDIAEYFINCVFVFTPGVVEKYLLAIAENKCANVLLIYLFI